jgi:hypothetical protein
VLAEAATLPPEDGAGRHDHGGAVQLICSYMLVRVSEPMGLVNPPGSAGRLKRGEGARKTRQEDIARGRRSLGDGVRSFPSGLGESAARRLQATLLTIAYDERLAALDA